MSARHDLWLVGADPAFAAVVALWCERDGWQMSRLGLGEALARRRSGEGAALVMLDADGVGTAVDAALLLSLVCDMPLIAATALPDAAGTLREAGAALVLRKRGGSAGLGLLRPGDDGCATPTIALSRAGGTR